MSKRNTRNAFTLVELVVVVLILGIIAAVAVPRVIRSTSSAGESALKQDLAAIRSAIELYASDHGGIFPGANADGLGNNAGSEEAFKNQLTSYTKADGNASADKDPTFPFGPYLRKPFPKAPIGPNVGTDDVKIETTGVLLDGADETTAWRYDTTTGEFILNSNDVSSDGATNYDAY